MEGGKGERAIVRIDLLSILSLFGGTGGALDGGTLDGAQVASQLVQLLTLAGVQPPGVLLEAAENNGVASIPADELLQAVESVAEQLGIELNQTISIPTGIPGLPPITFNILQLAEDAAAGQTVEVDIGALIGALLSAGAGGTDAGGDVGIGDGGLGGLDDLLALEKEVTVVDGVD